jgi:predicted phage terminase large subunit-like protein
VIRKTAEADGPRVKVYHEQEPGSGGKQSAQQTDRDTLKGFNSESDQPKGDKVYRADPLSVQVNRGNILLLNAIWNKDFIEEYRDFPFGKFKDQVDAGSGAYSKLTGKRMVKTH